VQARGLREADPVDSRQLRDLAAAQPLQAADAGEQLHRHRPRRRSPAPDAEHQRYQLGVLEVLVPITCVALAKLHLALLCEGDAAAAPAKK